MKKVLARQPEKIYERLFRTERPPYKELLTVLDFTGKPLKRKNK